jgi:deferrochelatase/peroxidase EfeB
MFLCYGATIEEQFEFLVRRWANSAIQPDLGGHDSIIGQRDERGNRTRFVDLPTRSGSVRLELNAEWVTPTGGGYFFAPPITALADVLGA